MKPQLLLLSNLSNELPGEDLFLQKYLSDDFEVTIRHPMECEDTEDAADLILIRNIWLTSEYETEWEEIQSRFAKKKLRTYNPLTGKGDTTGKDYLLSLFQAQYPVIPTVNNIQDLNLLPQADFFISKPKKGGSGVGVKKVSRKELLAEDLQGHVIQPYIDFQYEISFYFIDGQLQYALSAPDKQERWDLVEYKPSDSEIAFAQRFVEWNALPYGIQRIDACSLRNRELLLMEIEDLCPYLSLLDIKQDLRDKFLNNLKTSLQTVVGEMIEGDS